MPAATVTSKGQVTIPSEVRTEFNIVSGDQLIFYRDIVGGDLRVRVRKPVPGAAERSLDAKGRSVSIEEMSPSADRPYRDMSDDHDDQSSGDKAS